MWEMWKIFFFFSNQNVFLGRVSLTKWNIGQCKEGIVSRMKNSNLWWHFSLRVIKPRRGIWYGPERTIYRHMVFLSTTSFLQFKNTLGKKLNHFSLWRKKKPTHDWSERGRTIGCRLEGDALLSIRSHSGDGIRPRPDITFAQDLF